MAWICYFHILLLFGLALALQSNKDIKPKLLYGWATVDFLYSSEEDRTNEVQEGSYTPEHVVILDSDFYFSKITSTKRVFVTTPQFKSGIPATLSEVTREKNGDSYLLNPFPDWGKHRESISICEGPLSVYRINIDKCGLLWVLDTGRVDTFTHPTRLCRPKLLVYDLNNHDQLVESYEFPDGTINDRSNLVTLVTESYTDDCRDSVAYIADVNAYGLVVFDLASKTSWRIEHNIFYPFPHKGTITIAGVTFDLMDGIIGLALGPGNDSNRKLYFHSLASVRESWAPVSVLKNTTLIQDTNFLRKHIYYSEDAREGQSSLEVMTEDGILVYAILPKTALACWNSATPFVRRNQYIIYEDFENLQFVSGMKLKNNKALLITTSRLQNYIAGHSNSTDIKYRMLLFEDIDQLLKGTACKIENSHHGSQKPVFGVNPQAYTSFAKPMLYSKQPSVIGNGATDGSPPMRSSVTGNGTTDGSPPMKSSLKDSVPTDSSISQRKGKSS